MNKTSQQYDQIIDKAEEIFRHKTADYGPVWRILRLPSITDQMYIKAKRLRQIQETGKMLVNENPADAFYALVNYAAMALVQAEKGVADEPDIDNDTALEWYREQIRKSKELMLRKTHDYGEAWRDMLISSMTDIILQKLLRIKQIEQNKGKTLISEGVEGNFRDILNYAVFSLIKMELEGEKM
ncbi:MAG: DUF1599 domain-containing protein [Chlorobi bacterium]|nr:DUF1599 domain-containing protein [Chlorobiota bacterium]